MSTDSAASVKQSQLDFSALRRNAPLLIVYGLIIGAIILGTAKSDRFLTDRNLLNVLRQAAFLGLIAIGQTLVILSGGIDLSIGSLVKLSVLVAAIWMDGKSENLLPAALLTVGVGLLVGLIHAAIITQFRVAPFIVTLGSYSVLRGIALGISEVPTGKAAPELTALYDRKLVDLFSPLQDSLIGEVFVLIIIFAVVLLAVIAMLRWTPFGRYIYAVGGNDQVARRSGIPVDRVKFGVYGLCSSLAALTGLFFLSRYGVSDPVIGDGLELQTITAVILGGTSLFGGRGGLFGTLGGVLLLGLTANLLVVLNVSQWFQELIRGAVIVVAVALYKQKGRR